MCSTVYHYTSPQGAFDILSNKALWFTDCQYLNDMGEFVYIREPLKEAYERISQERNEKTDDIDNFLQSFFVSPYEDMDFECILKQRRRTHRGYPAHFRYYVLCASKNADTANMWNYYVKDGAYRGYNLGLDCSVIKDWFSRRDDDQINLIEGQVIYNQEKQVDIVYNKLKELLTRFDEMIQRPVSNDDDSTAIEEFQDDLLEFINKQKIFFKSPAFESEQEYRFVLKVHNDFSHANDIKANFRVGSSGIVTPYIEWHFGNLKPILLKQITLSPMIEPELAQESFKRFLADDVYRNIDIKPSAIKLRF